jgi:hypothetical protein
VANDAEHAVPHHCGEHLVPEPLNQERVLADEERREVFDRGLDDARPAGGLADAVDAFVRHDLHEAPVP